jgi:hypothetical protein
LACTLAQPLFLHQQPRDQEVLFAWQRSLMARQLQPLMVQVFFV